MVEENQIQLRNHDTIKSLYRFGPRFNPTKKARITTVLGSAPKYVQLIMRPARFNILIIFLHEIAWNVYTQSNWATFKALNTGQIVKKKT
jgi:hypothetical protein